MDALIAEAVVAMDDAARADRLARAMEVYVDDAGTIPVVNLYSIWADRKDKAVYEARSDDATSLLDLTTAAVQ